MLRSALILSITTVLVTGDRKRKMTRGLMFEDLHGFLTKTLRKQKSYAQINPDVSSLRKHAFTQILFVHPKLAWN